MTVSEGLMTIYVDYKYIKSKLSICYHFARLANAVH